ncbi:hypothetical protein ACQE3E_06540 [Methylomonas sp. MED-D]|uniref:hypothetical protein n=1 Tax=Methylomonas sp. MED-D TaxID=3418768 RepID=UPI003CFDDE26
MIKQWLARRALAVLRPVVQRLEAADGPWLKVPVSAVEGLTTRVWPRVFTLANGLPMEFSEASVLLRVNRAGDELVLLRECLSRRPIPVREKLGHVADLLAVLAKKAASGRGAGPAEARLLADFEVLISSILDG